MTGGAEARNARWMVLMIAVVALGLRLWPVNFGLPALNDPDELMFELGAVQMLRTHTLNPGWFGHPATTTMYLLAVIDLAVFLVGHVAGRFVTPASFMRAVYLNPAWIILPGRLLMVAFGVWTVLLTRRLAERIAGREAGYAAGMLLAVSPVHIAWSQVVRSDIMASAFLLLTLLSALDVMEGKPRIARGALWCALAAASKWPFALGGLAMAGALIWLRHKRQATLSQTLRGGALFALLLPAFLVLISPYLMIEPKTVIANVAGEAQVQHLGATGGGPLDNAWWYLSGPLPDGLGLTGLLCCCFGAIALTKSPPAWVIVAPLIGAFLIALSCQHLVWERWILPLLPLLSVFGGAGMAGLATRLKPRLGATLAMTAVVSCTCIPLMVSDAAAAHARANNTAQQASAWAMTHVPAGSTVFVEHFGFDLLTQPWHLLFPFGDAGCVDPREALSSKITLHKIASGRGGRSNVDFGTVTPTRRADCAADYAILTQYDRYRAEKERYPQEYGAYVQLLGTGRIVATFEPRKGQSSGRIVRIVYFPRRAPQARASGI